MAASRRVLPLVNAVDPVVTKFLPAITPLTYRFHVWKKAFRVVVAGGVLCGVLDLTAAFVVYGFRGAGPIRILQSITAGLLGADSYDGGTTTAALGGILHFVIAFNVTAFYYVLSRKLELLIRQPVLAGILYGPAVYAFMNLIVLPLSAYPHRISNKVDLLLAGLIIHIFCVGLPIALVVSGYEKSRNALYKENFL